MGIYDRATREKVVLASGNVFLTVMCEYQLCVSTFSHILFLSVLLSVFSVFVVKTGCCAGTWVTWRGTVQSQQVGQYDKDGKTGCGAGLQAGGKALLITSVRFQVLRGA